MSELTLSIVSPANGAAIAGADPVTLQGAVSDATGLFFKWFSSLNSKATMDHPELNAGDHSATALNFSHPLPEFGSHVIVLAATDREGSDLASVKAVTRAAMAGGAPPAAKPPCVVHQVSGAKFHPSLTSGQTLSKGRASIALLAPGSWLKPDPGNASQWIANTDYQALNGVALRLRLAPAGAPDQAHSENVPLDLKALPAFQENGKSWLRWTGALPVNLGLGDHLLSLIASAGAVSATISMPVTLAP